MKNIAVKVLLVITVLLLIFSCKNRSKETSIAAYTPVSFKKVKITDNFWLSKIDSNQQNGIPGCFESCNHSLINFDIAAGESTAKREGTIASDSDVYKIIQGAAHTLDHISDPALEQFVDSLIVRIVAAQEEDGYLYTHWSISDLSQRWTQIETKHELYCAGHLFEAAAAYYQVTGKRKLLDVAIRLADHIDSVFGPGKLENISGHQEIELALIKLFEVTGENRYLNLAEFFLEERGNPERLAYRASLGDKDPNFGTPERFLKPAYRQDHLPVKDQRKATGHAVRAAYLYSGMTDYARITGSGDYLPALKSIWHDIVDKKIYVTGSIGTAEFHDEGFGSEYSLPNKSAYCETCSAIALMLWNYRMAALTGEAKYLDLFELTLYNGGLSGGSAKGDRFFYTNPLEGNPRHNRHPWYEPGCCPSNFVRFIPQIDQFIYGQKNNTIYINQFIGSELSATINNNNLLLKLSTNYPWDNIVDIEIELSGKVKAGINIRIPAWLRGQFYPGELYQYSTANEENELSVDLIVSVNGRKVSLQVDDKGFICLNRTWKNMDKIHIEFSMPVKLVEGHPNIKDVEDQKVLSRGPVIYCLEELDNKLIMENPDLFEYIPGEFIIQTNNEFTHGINTISGRMQYKDSEKSVEFKAIPYFSWRNRGPTNMLVWF